MFELTETQKQLQATAREFAKKEIAPRAAEIDRTEQYPWENVELLTKQGFMGMTVPEEYGGSGASYLDVVLVIEVTNDALQIFGSAGYSRNLPLERMARDARMFTIGGVDASEALTYTHQVFDHTELLKSVTKASIRVVDGAVDVAIDKAVAIAMDGQPGPVHIDVPIGVAAKEQPERPINVRNKPSLNAPAEGKDLDTARLFIFRIAQIKACHFPVYQFRYIIIVSLNSYHL